MSFRQFYNFLVVFPFIRRSETNRINFRPSFLFLKLAHSIWAGSGPAQNGWARSGPVFFFKKKKLAKKYCLGFFFLQFPRVFVTLFFINIGLYFYVIKNTKSSIKIPGFRQNFQNTKNFEKKEKNVFVHTAKCLKS